MIRILLKISAFWILCLSQPLASMAAGPGDFQQKFSLLPKPQKVELLKGKGILPYSIVAMVLKGVEKRPVLSAPLEELPLADRSGAGTLTLHLADKPTIPQKPESYVLEVSQGQVNISARDQAGLFYGCQTLLQLLEDARDQNIPIPACRISDFPGIPYRAVHWDLKYHLDNLQYYYQMIDRLAAIKVNAVIVEFEDKLKYRKAPIVGAANAISIEEFAALTRYARERFIEISPLVQGLGHASFILKQDAYKPLRDDPGSDWVFDPLNPEVYQLQFKLYADALEATPQSRFLHVGGDEVYNLGRSELARKSGMSTVELQLYWLNKVCEYARKQNRIPIIWDDMPFSLAGLYMTMHDPKMSVQQIDSLWKIKKPELDKNIHLFPKDCIYMRWHYAQPKLAGNLKAIEWMQSNGLKVMAASATQDMNAMLPRKNSIFAPTRDFCEIATTQKLEGILATAWDDSSPHFETYWRGFYDFASMSWNHRPISPEQAHREFRHRFYAPEVANDSFEFQDSLETALSFWDTALIQPGGDRSHYPGKIELISLPDPANAGKWAESHASKIRQAHNELKRYQLIRNRIQATKQNTVRNRFALDLLYAMNELQIYPARLITALQAFDVAAQNQKPALLENITKIRESFQKTRSDYEEVFSKTRFLHNAEGYILDQNNDRMLANGTNSSDWMHVYELAMNKAIQDWTSGHKTR